MNRAALKRTGLTLRVIPPRAGCALFPQPADYEAAVAAIQRLRGGCYLADGAISTDALDSQGRHITPDDELSYHITLWNGEVQGCLRIQLHPRPGRHFTEYRVYDLIRRMPVDLAKSYHVALEDYIQFWRNNNYEVGDIGGWAASLRYRANAAMLVLPLAVGSFSKILSRQIWIAAATERNGSAEMLRRLGGWRLKLHGEELPPFFDSSYNCKMELLCFDSETFNPKLEPAVADLQRLLLEQTIRGATQ